jgi:hypothetical protein
MAPPNIVEKIADALHLPGAKGATTKPIFDNEKVTVIFVLGGPGAGSVFLSFPPPSLWSLPYALPLELIIIGDIPRFFFIRKRNAVQPPRREISLLSPLRGRPPPRRAGPPGLAVR